METERQYLHTTHIKYIAMAQFGNEDQVKIDIPSCNINGTKGTVKDTYSNDQNEDVYDILVEESPDVFMMIGIREENLTSLN